MRAFAILLVVALVPSALAGTQEVPLPEGWTNPTTIGFAPDGSLWVALAGSWAVGRFDPATSQGELIPLASPPLPPPEGAPRRTDELFALRFAPDGTIWTASGNAIHHIEPARRNATAYRLPVEALLPGDVHLAKDGTVWYALIDKDKLAHLDPAGGIITLHNLPEEHVGPVAFLDAPNAYLTATYANTVAAFDESTGAVKLGPRGILQGPVGIARLNDSLVVAEMGGSGVTILDPATWRHERYPTSASTEYPATGPSGILAHPDGSVWFAEHFADRIARLDPERGWLTEYEYASAPGANVQRLALAPDGDVWFAEYGTSRIGRASWTKEPPIIHTNFSATVLAGETVHVEAHTLMPLSAATPDENITARVASVKQEESATTWDVAIQTARSLAPGTYHLLLSMKDPEDAKVTTGRYLDLAVLPAAPAKTPVHPVFTMMALGLAALAVRRRR